MAILNDHIFNIIKIKIKQNGQTKQIRRWQTKMKKIKSASRRIGQIWQKRQEQTTNTIWLSRAWERNLERGWGGPHKVWQRSIIYERINGKENNNTEHRRLPRPTVILFWCLICVPNKCGMRKSPNHFIKWQYSMITFLVLNLWGIRKSSNHHKVKWNFLMGTTSNGNPFFSTWSVEGRNAEIIKSSPYKMEIVKDHISAWIFIRSANFFFPPICALIKAINLLGPLMSLTK
jgi:hypothetical protein